ncbi:MAG: protein NO VEIN domain-containing protein [Candidatus Cryptobacteroides sp.]
MKNTKSDIAAKAAFVEELRQRGFSNVKVVAAPADIEAEKDGEKWYFEIKKTTHNDKYFGAATLTEWVQAVTDPEHFRFVVAITTDRDQTFDFIEYTPADFMAFSTVPPFKIFFNIDFRGEKKVKLGGKALMVSRELVEKLRDVYYGMKGID